MSPPGSASVSSGSAIGNDPPCVIIKKIVRSETFGKAPSAEALAQEYSGIHYIDGATPLLGADGKPSGDYLVWDGLHLNEQGYAVWTALLRPALIN